MKKLNALLVAGLLLAPLFSTVQAQVDQSNYSSDGPLTYANGDNGQTFTPSYSNSTGAAFLLSDYGGRGSAATLYVQLRTSYSGSVLASGSSVFALGPSQGSWVSVFWSPVAVTPSTQYYLAFTTDDNYSVAAEGTFSGPDYYTGGGLWNSGGDYTAYNYDYTFAEYASEVAAVPEPATFVLLGTGLVGVFGIARRRNKTVA